MGLTKQNRKTTASGFTDKFTLWPRVVG